MSRHTTGDPDEGAKDNVKCIIPPLEGLLRKSDKWLGRRMFGRAPLLGSAARRFRAAEGRISIAEVRFRL